MISDKTRKELALAKEFEVNEEFDSIEEFKVAFTMSAMDKGIKLRVSQRNKKYITMKCKEESCKFKVLAGIVIKKSKCVVKTMNPFHSCNNSNDEKLPCTVKTIVQRTNVSTITPRCLVDKIQIEYGKKISYHTARSAINSVKKNYGLVIDDAYSYIPSLVENIRRNGDFSEYLCSKDGFFQRFFIMWSASQEFFMTSRRLLYIDGTFLVGPNKGTLLVAISQDSCDQLVLMAIGIVESENLSSWNWFLQMMSTKIPMNNKDTIIFSDRERGIINAVNSIAPLSSKAYCVRHIAKNLKRSFRDSKSMEYFWKAAYTYSIQEFNSIMESLKNYNLLFYKRLDSIGVNTWANALFPVPRFGKMTTNPVESMNSALKKFIDKDVCSLIIAINNYAMEIYNERRQKKFSTQIVDSCLKLLNRNIMRGRVFTVQSSNEDIYLVNHKYIIDILNGRCTCEKSPHIGVPCEHICAVLGNKNIDPISFVSKAYLSETYYGSFVKNILPLSSLDLNKSDINPPVARRSRGRPRIKRILSHFEK